MINSILILDKLLFKFINQEWTNPILDQIMPFVTDFNNTKYFLLVLALGWIALNPMRGLKVVLACALSIALSDVVAYRIVKQIVRRPRPQFAEVSARLLVPSTAGYSFPSNHASNCFAAAMTIAMQTTHGAPLVFFLAWVVGYSRVYVGVHYPIDVVGGAILGILCAQFVNYLLILLFGFIGLRWEDPVSKSINRQSWRFRFRKKGRY